MPVGTAQTCETLAMKRLFLAAVSLATAAVVLVGCGSSDAVQQAEGVTVMVLASQPSAVMDALITGTLTITDSGCFAVTNGDTTYPLQFPYGTRLETSGDAVTVPGLPPLREGDQIRGGGGYLHLSDVPPECAADNEYDEYAVWQTVPGE